MSNQGTSWSDADIGRLADLYFSVPRPSIDEIASQLGRTKKAVWTEISRLGMSKPGAKLRACLGHVCDGRKRFFSSSINERICSFCKQTKRMRCA